MRVESTLSAPVHGISTYAPQNREVGYASEQVNFRSDPLTKLSKRPPLVWGGRTLASSTAHVHYVNHADSEYRLFIERDGTVLAYTEGLQPVTVNGTLSANYTNVGDLITRSYGNRTFVLNADKTVVMDALTDSVQYDADRATHINVTSALNYGEKLTVNWVQDGQPDTKFTYTVPDLGATPDYDTADKARATDAVAAGIATAINANANLTAVAKGSSVIVRGTGWVQLEIETGQGANSVIAFNQEIQNINALPKFGKAGTVLKVKPSPTSDRGTYYIKAEPTTAPLSSFLPQEVVWTEWRSPSEKYRLDAATMPHVIEFDEATGEFTCGLGAWEDREAGDNDSSEPPVFVDNKIRDLTIFQNRLVALTDEEVVTTVTDDLFDWWRRSAVQRVVTDPVSIASTATDIERLAYFTFHNRDLLIISSNAQFKISGSEALTPQTAAMPLMAQYNVDVSVRAVSMGTAVYIPINYGESSGVLRYTGQRDRVDEGKPVTDHVVNFMQGRIRKMTSEANLGLIILQTDGMPNNEVAVFEEMYPREQTDNRSSAVQKSWSTWQFPTDTVIHDFKFRDGAFEMYDRASGVLTQKKLQLYSRLGYVGSEVVDIFLDDYLTATAVNGTTITLPVGYPTTELSVISSTGAKYPLHDYKYTIVGDTITLAEPMAATSCEVVVGRRMVSIYEPTRPYRRNDDGSVITSDRLRINRYVLELVDTYRLKLHITSPYYTETETEFNSRQVGGVTSALGEVRPYSGTIQFPFGHEAGQAKAVLYHDDFLNCSVATIGWVGQYYQTSRRI